PAKAFVTANVAGGGPNSAPTALRIPLTKDRYAATYKLPTNFTAAAVAVTASLHVPFGGHDIVSTPSATQLPVAAPSGFPTIVTAALRLTSVNGTGLAHGSLYLTGDKSVAGEVCIGRVEYATPAPVELTRLIATRPGRCVKVAPRAHVVLPFS